MTFKFRLRGQHKITCDIEMVRMEEINNTYERMLKSDVEYRFVMTGHG